MLGGAGSAALLRVEQTDLINYGLIPEFVGRFPVISTLQARPVAATPAQALCSLRKVTPLPWSCACKVLGSAQRLSCGIARACSQLQQVAFLGEHRCRRPPRPCPGARETGSRPMPRAVCPAVPRAGEQALMRAASGRRRR